MLGGLLGGGGGGALGGLLGGGLLGPVGNVVGQVVNTVDNVLDSVGLGISVGGLLGGSQPRQGDSRRYSYEVEEEVEVVRMPKNQRVSIGDRSLGGGNAHIGESGNIRFVDLSKIPSERIIMGFARGMNVSSKNPDGTVSQVPYTIPALFVLNATRADVSQLSV